MRRGSVYAELRVIESTPNRGKGGCGDRAVLLDGWAFDLEVLALALRLRHKVVEVGIEWRDDERSRVHPLRDLSRVISETLTLERNLARGVYGPLYFSPRAS